MSDDAINIPCSGIFEVKRFEDNSGRSVYARIDGSVAQYFGQIALQSNTGQQMQITFPILAKDIFEAFMKFDETAKIEKDKITDRIQKEQIKKMLTSGLSMPPKAPQRILNGRK